MTSWPEQRVEEVADGVIAVLQGRGEAGVSNAGIVVDGADAAVIDTFMFPAMAAGLMRELDRRGARAALVVNTHHHVDHIGGNEVFGAARIVAHERAVETVARTGHPTAVYDAFMPAFRGEFESLDIQSPLPVAATDVLPRGGVLVPYAPAHTPGDLAVWLPEARVLFAGDLCFFGVVPLALQGLVSAWVAALDDLSALEPDVVVPGHGPIGGVDDLRTARDYLAAVLEVGRAAVDAGATLDDAVIDFRKRHPTDAIEDERTIVNLERSMQEASGLIGPESLDTLPTSFGRLLEPS